MYVSTKHALSPDCYANFLASGSPREWIGSRAACPLHWPSTSATHVAQPVTLHRELCLSQSSYDQLRTSSLVPIADLHKIIQNVMVDFKFTNSVLQFFLIGVDCQKESRECGGMEPMSVIKTLGCWCLCLKREKKYDPRKIRDTPLH